MPSHLDELNEQQRQAVLHLDGPLLVHAPVGTGKTTVLAHRAAHAIGSGRDPGSLLCLSFTNRAARQMRERIMTLLGGKANEIGVRTFHGFCTHVLRLEADNLGLHCDFTICDEADARELLLDAWRQHTQSDFACEQFAGDHFYFKSAGSQASVLALVRQRCLAAAAAGPAGETTGRARES